MIETVLVYIQKNQQYLLIHKQKKDMNQGKYLGIGGKIEPNESIEQALLRETYEETGLTLLAYKHRANIFFHSGDYTEKMYLYTSNSFKGSIQASDEGNLVWVPIEQIKNLPMWAGDYLFLDKLQTSDAWFEMHLVYQGETLIHHY